MVMVCSFPPNAKGAVPAGKNRQLPSLLARFMSKVTLSVRTENTWMVMLLPTPQPIMVVIQVLVARLLVVRNPSDPATLFHDPLGSENGVFIIVVPVEMRSVLDQMSVFDVPPAITITSTDSGNVPGGMADRLGHELTNFHGLWHR
ncbi:hypothetical protein DESC_970004 [Desulfosarcina cetonica]|nr:hypothetical protein DESC_970004 [Desulfosarcina cetonica]